MLATRATQKGISKTIMKGPAAMQREPASPTLCPLCEATIPEGHTKCLFCGTILERPKQEKVSNKPAVPSEGFVVALLALLALSLLALLFGVHRLSPLAPRGLLFLSVVALSHLTAAVLVALDARQLNVKAKGYGTAWQWFGATLIFMPLVLVVYGSVRARCRGEEWNRPLVVLACLWLAIALYVGNTARPRVTIAPEVQRALDEQLNRTLGPRSPDHFDANATVAPAQPQ